MTHGANHKVVDKDNKNTPLHVAASKNSDRHYDIAVLLVNHGANVDAKNASGKKALDLAVNEKSKCSKMMILFFYSLIKNKFYFFIYHEAKELLKAYTVNSV